MPTKLGVIAEILDSKRRETMFSPAYVHNPAMQGHHDRTCECGTTFNVWKISRLKKCKPCHESHAEAWCGRCGGTGKFVRRIENDVPVGEGTCFRCNGKGYQTESDKRRNEYYDVHRAINL
jgi:hypothetical protein